MLARVLSLKLKCMFVYGSHNIFPDENHLHSATRRIKPFQSTLRQYNSIRTNKLNKNLNQFKTRVKCLIGSCATHRLFLCINNNNRSREFKLLRLNGRTFLIRLQRKYKERPRILYCYYQGWNGIIAEYVTAFKKLFAIFYCFILLNISMHKMLKIIYTWCITL